MCGIASWNTRTFCNTSDCWSPSHAMHARCMHCMQNSSTFLLKETAFCFSPLRNPLHRDNSPKELSEERFGRKFFLKKKTSNLCNIGEFSRSCLSEQIYVGRKLLENLQWYLGQNVFLEQASGSFLQKFSPKQCFKTILWKNYPCINGFLKPHFFNIFFGIDVYFYGKLSEMLQTKLAAVFEKHIEFLFLFWRVMLPIFSHYLCRLIHESQRSSYQNIEPSWSVAMSKVLMNRSVFLLQAFSKFSVCLKIIQKAGNWRLP